MAEEPKKIKLEDILPKYTLEDMLEPDPYVRAELGVINKNFDELELEIGRKLMEAREAKNKDRNVLVDENDPTLGDFEPL